MGIIESDLPSRGIECGHMNVHNNYVGLQSVYCGNGFFAIFCLANQFHLWIACEDLFENLADQGFSSTSNTRVPAIDSTDAKGYCPDLGAYYVFAF